MRKGRSLPIRLLRDNEGNVLPIAAVGLLVGAAMVGSAIDIGRDYKVKQQIQAACDSAVLAGRRTVTTAGFDEPSELAARTYFDANFDYEALGTDEPVFEIDSDDGGKTITAVASTTLPTLIMRIFGFDQFDVRVTCGSSMGVGNADVMMVLDTTGSMINALDGSTRIAVLQSAMKAFYTTLENATANTNARIRYGFVPYSTTVNVGRLLDQDYIANSATYQSREPNFEWTQNGYKSTPASTSAVTSYSDPVLSSSTRGGTSYNTQATCDNVRPADNTDFVNNGNSSNGSAQVTYVGDQKVSTVRNTQPQKKLTYVCQLYNKKYYVYTQTWARSKYTDTSSYYDQYWYWKFKNWTYKAMLRDTSTYKTFAATTIQNGSSGTNQTSTWGGCIHERRTQRSATFSYVAANDRIDPEDALDVDLDTAPDASDEGSKWAPLWPQVVFHRYDSDGYRTQDDVTTTTNRSPATSSCPAAAQELQEMDEQAFNAYADSLQAQGNTYLDIGLIWGGRLLSPQGIFQDNVNEQPDNGGEVSRHIVFMTDGFMDPSPSYNAAWGVEPHDRRVTDDTTMSDSDRLVQDTARHNQRMQAVCEAIRAKGIRLWVIAFTSALSSNLTRCASDNSSFTAANSAQLSTAFQEIAKQVGELRITQ